MQPALGNSVYQPAVPRFTDVPAPRTVVTLQGRTLQVITKIAEIILTPESPTYEGGSWHVEGMKNESIVATGIYYFDVQNITESRLRFRQAVDKPDDYSGDFTGRDMLQVYGLTEDRASNQDLGSVVTCGDRCICFPNIYQHRVAPFSLVDPTRPGVRKILVFFLVDPGKRIISTAQVPPQQQHYLRELLRPVPPFNTMIPEMLDLVLMYTDCPMSLDEAKKHRAQLMAERKFFVDEFTRQVYARSRCVSTDTCSPS